MKVRHIYTVTLGTNSDKYVCIGNDNRGWAILRRVRKPTSKIDSLRLPETIHIKEFGKSLIKPNNLHE